MAGKYEFEGELPPELRMHLDFVSNMAILILAFAFRRVACSLCSLCTLLTSLFFSFLRTVLCCAESQSTERAQAVVGPRALESFLLLRYVCTSVHRSCFAWVVVWTVYHNIEVMAIVLPHQRNNFCSLLQRESHSPSTETAIPTACSSSVLS